MKKLQITVQGMREAGVSKALAIYRFRTLLEKAYPELRVGMRIPLQPELFTVTGETVSLFSFTYMMGYIGIRAKIEIIGNDGRTDDLPNYDTLHKISKKINNLKDHQG